MSRPAYRDRRGGENRAAHAFERALLAAAIVCLSWYGWRMHEIVTRTGPGHRAGTAGDCRPRHRAAAWSAGRRCHRRARDSTPASLRAGQSRRRRQRPRFFRRLSAGHAVAVDAGQQRSLPRAHRDPPPPPPPPVTVRSEHIREGDAITLATTHGELRYRVLKTLIVDPKDIWVLKPLPNVSLTLITCYPFSFVGHAPHRFIVQAEKL